MPLPTEIILNGETLRRQRSRGRWEMRWVCDRNFNILVRNKQGLWSFVGGPLPYTLRQGPEGWYTTPEAAYVGALQAMIPRIRERCERDLAKVIEAIDHYIATLVTAPPVREGK